MRLQTKLREWLRRYAWAELLGTILALLCAGLVYRHTHSYLAATGAGMLGEGIGFYGYFIAVELHRHGLRSENLPLYKRLPAIFAKSGTSLFVEFAPAEIIDNLFVRPLAMYIVPQHIKPYAVGFIVGKVAADLLFYVLAIAGYEAKRRWFRTRV